MYIYIVYILLHAYMCQKQQKQVLMTNFHIIDILTCYNFVLLIRFSLDFTCSLCKVKINK